MSKRDFLKNIAAQLSDLLPTHIGTLKKDFEKNCHQKLRQIFHQFDLVTREEFDIQTKVLIRTRKKLEEVEQHLKQLEALLSHKDHR